MKKSFLLVLSLCGWCLLSACGGGGGGGSVSPAPISVAITQQPPVSLVVSGTASVSATVTNDSTAKGVDWTVTCGSLGACGSFNPTHTASGANTVYAAPASVPTGNAVTIIATSTADNTKSAQATATITTTAISVAFSMGPPASVVPSGAANLAATVTNDSMAKGVDWTVTCGSTGACGSFNPTHTASGADTVYTAPTSVPTGNTVTIIATSTADNTKSAQATATITTTAISVAFSIAPPFRMSFGGTISVAATVANDAGNKGVDWTVGCAPFIVRGGCGIFSLTHTPSGAVTLYTAPNDTLQVTIFATSTADNTKSVSGSVTLEAAQEQQQEQKKEHPRYRLIDLGTFGGPASFVVDGGGLNERGVVWGGSATSTPTLPTSNPLVCGGAAGTVPFIFHTFRSQNDTVTDLGALPGGSNCSTPFGVNANGEIVGVSENGDVDPLTGVNQTRAVLWKDGETTELGSFGGNQNAALGNNNRGQIVGNSQNTIPDPFSFIDCLLGSCNGTQTRAALWQQGQMRDLGTLGSGEDASAAMINERGQIAGQSYTNTTPNSVTGLPTVDPFLWENGKMLDLGTLGGTFGLPFALNNRGEVVGQSNLAGDLSSDPFLWDQGKLIDLSTTTVGGNPVTANAINDAGEIVGGAAFPGVPFDAYLWRNGVATDLGTLNGDCLSEAFAINSHDQVVGNTFLCDFTHSRAFLWEDGEITDLNALIPADSALQLVIGDDINDRGEIAGIGVPIGVSPANWDTQGHAFLLIPCDGDHADVEGCEDRDEDAAAAIQGTPAVVTQAPATAARISMTPSDIMAAIRGRLFRRSRRFGIPQPPTK